MGAAAARLVGDPDVGMASAQACSPAATARPSRPRDRFDSARLNGRGTANSGPTTSYVSSTWPRTQRSCRSQRPLTEQVGGPSDPNGPLQGFPYSYRLCGGDLGEPAVCAQTRTFTPASPTRDAVKGFWSIGSGPAARRGRVDASSTATGASPTGVLRLFKYLSPQLAFAGRVTCLEVSGARGALGAVGEVTTDGSDPDPNASPPTTTALVTVIDGVVGNDRTAVVVTPGSATPPELHGRPARHRGDSGRHGQRLRRVVAEALHPPPKLLAPGRLAQLVERSPYKREVGGS